MTSSATPTSLGGYTLLELIGQGGMGEVFRAERSGPSGVKHRAAVKRLRTEAKTDGVLRERFLAEARITARLEHSNIVRLIDFGDTPELYLVLEYVEGPSLAELMRRASAGAGVLPVAAVLFVAAETANALSYAHKRKDEQGRAMNIVHRDISPPNILLSLDGAVKLGDFGIARAADSQKLTQAGFTIGKIVYMAPEQALGLPTDARSDLFALGAVLWEALTLRPLIPRDGAASALEALQAGTFAPPSKWVPGLPPAVDALVMQALASDPDRRTPTAEALERALRSALHGIGSGFDKRDLSEVVRRLVPDVVVRAGGSIPDATGAARSRVEAPAAPAFPPTNESAYDTQLTDGRSGSAPAPPPVSAPSAPPETSAPPRTSAPASPALPARSLQPQSPLPTHQRPKPRPARRRWPWALLALVVCALAASGGTYYFYPNVFRPSSPAPSARVTTGAGLPDPMTTVQSVARACAVSLGLLGTTGSVTIDATCGTDGRALRVRAVVGSGTPGYDAAISACLESDLPSTQLAPASDHESAQHLVVAF